jgi:hypothetical protein
MGKLAVVKTTQNNVSVEDFINSIEGENKRKDSFSLLEMMQKISQEEPKMWGKSLIGFGKLRYKSPASGREVDWFTIGFSPRKANISIYLMNLQIHEESLKNLGKHKTGSGCLYINKLEDVNYTILEEIIRRTITGK